MIEHLRSHTFSAAFSLLPPHMDTPEAQAMLIAIGLQESRFKHRRQVNGPARGFWQFEKGGGVRGVLTHAKVAPIMAEALTAQAYQVGVDVLYAAIEHNDVIACVAARLLLWTVPGRLPGPDDPEVGWQQYLDGWRPGKPHRGTWDAFYREAWSQINRVETET